MIGDDFRGGDTALKALAAIPGTILSDTFLDEMAEFSGKTIAQLREVAVDASSKSQDAVITELIAEMETRIKRREQQGKPAKKEQREFLDELRVGKVAPPKRVPIVIAKPESPDDELQRLRHELELWRSLYSHETERLARWGMTDSLPIEIVEKVLALWSKRLEAEPEDSIRTKERLEIDLPTIVKRAVRKS